MIVQTKLKAGNGLPAYQSSSAEGTDVPTLPISGGPPPP